MYYEVTIPVLNEEDRLETGIENTISFLESNGIYNKWSIVIADNGSTDNTPVIAKKLKEKYKYQVICLLITSKGVGLALIESWAKSNKDIVGYMDVDLATDI